MSSRLRAAWIAAALAIAAVLVTGGAAAFSPTQAAWSDRSYASAVATAGTWSTTPALGCTAMSSGTAVKGATCAVTKVDYQQWTDGKSLVRDYYVSYSMSAGDYPAVVVDLSKASGTVSGEGTWTWGKAVTLSTGQYTVAGTYACSELPMLRADGPSWGPSSTLWVRVVMDRSMPLATGITCR